MPSSLGFVNDTNMRQHPNITQSDSIPNSLSINSSEHVRYENRSRTKSIAILRYLFVLSLSIAEIYFIQSDLKTEHQHPHIPLENALQSLNIYFNVIVIYLSLNTLWYPLTHMYVTRHLQKYQAKIHFVYCILWGAAAGMILPIELSPLKTSRFHLTHLYISLVLLLFIGIYSWDSSLREQDNI